MSATNPSVSLVRASVIIVTYQNQATIGPCITALKMTLAPDDEVIVVDNNSSDDTADQTAKSFPEITLLRMESNVGFGAANNRGSLSARGQYLAFLNPDTIPTSGWLDALIAALASNPRVGIATAKVVLVENPERIDAFGNEVHISGLTTCLGWGQEAARFDALTEVGAASGACMAMRRAFFHRLGGFDARLFLYYEDTDISLRARLAGASCVAVPNAVVLHDHRPGFSPAKLRYLERNRYWTLLKLLHWRTLVGLTPVLLIAELLAWGFALKSGPRHLLAKVLAWKDILVWLRDLPQARRVANRTRNSSDLQMLNSHTNRLSFAEVDRGLPGRIGEELAAGLFSAARSMSRLILAH